MPVGEGHGLPEVAGLEQLLRAAVHQADVWLRGGHEVVVDRQGQLEPGVGRRVVLEQRQSVVGGKVAGGTDADHEFRCHAVMVSEQRDQPDRGTTSTSCPGRRQAVYAP